MKVSSAFSIETFSEKTIIFLETTLPQKNTLKETVGIGKHCFVILLKTFVVLAVGMVHTVPEHPTASTRSGLVCSREGFAPMFAITDVCPKKAPCYSQ